MGRRIPRNWKPAVELVEHRELLSLVTDIMAGNHNAVINSPKVRALLARRLGIPAQPPQAASATWHQVTASASGGQSGRFHADPRPRSPCPRTRAIFHPPTPATT